MAFAEGKLLNIGRQLAFIESNISKGIKSEKSFFIARILGFLYRKIVSRFLN